MKTENNYSSLTEDNSQFTHPLTPSPNRGWGKISSVDIKNRKIAFTLAEGATHVAPSKVCRRGGFTLAEVLITLAVVGVVAILVMPKLLDNVAERKYDAARKKALATIGEASRQIAMEGEMTSAVDAEDFVKNYLSKKLSIIQTCDNTNLKECGLETRLSMLKNFFGERVAIYGTLTNWGSLIGTYAATNYAKIDSNTTSYGFVMSNGYSVNLFYNPNCSYMNPKPSTWAAANEVCVHAIYDMNGLKGPNQYFKDIGFVTVLYPTMNSIAVSPNLYKVNLDKTDWDSAVKICADMGARLPSVIELTGLGSAPGSFTQCWSGAIKTQNTIYYLGNWTLISAASKSLTKSVICVKD